MARKIKRDEQNNRENEKSEEREREKERGLKRARDGEKRMQINYKKTLQTANHCQLHVL